MFMLTRVMESSCKCIKIACEGRLHVNVKLTTYSTQVLPLFEGINKGLVMDCCRDHIKTQKDTVDTEYSPRAITLCIVVSGNVYLKG